jgi:hypothetical protein
MRTIVAMLIVLSSSDPAFAQGAGAISRADANGDGRVSRSEFQTLRALGFERLDANGDAQLTAQERSAAQGRMGRQLARADANGDGVVTEAEFLNQPARAFDRFDANNDEALDADEMAALRAAMQRNGG